MTQRRIDCPVYRPMPNSRRCVDFIDNGGCRREDRFLCEEWLKANPHAGSSGDDGLGVAERPVAEPGPSRPGSVTAPADSSPEQRPAVVASAPRIVAARPLTEEDVASFRALDVEVCLRSEELGDVWLVPEYGGGGRNEIRVDHAATLAVLCSAFPGARTVAFKKRAPS